MKYLQFILILFLLAGCSGTKRIVNNSKKNAQEIKKINDSMINNVKIVKQEETPKTTQIKDSIEKPIARTQKNDSKNVISCHATEPIKGSIAIPHHRGFNKLLQEHVSKNGLVNYKTFNARRPDLLNYISYLSKNMPTTSWSTEDKLAYWINAYNAMTIDLILRHYPIKSIKEINKPWDQRFWKLGNKWFNLNEIEHEILRKMDEPRIHFAIVCASYSCPKLLNKAFTPSNLEEQLNEVTIGFLADSERNTISENNIQISKIFQWFAKDFKLNGSLIDFLNKYSTVEISAKAKKSFKDYNWNLNE